MDEQPLDQIDSAPQQAPVEQAPPPLPPANMLSQEQVNRIVAREKQKAAEAARREAEEKYNQMQSYGNRDSEVANIYQQVQERFNQEQNRLRQEFEDKQMKEHMNQVANNYLTKVEAAKGAYEDFDDVIKDFDPAEFPKLVYLLAGMDNAGHVLYDLSKNPFKLGAINNLAETSPKRAQKELLKLSQSIQANQQAQADSQAQTTADPLDRLQPSRVAGSNGKQTISDLRNQSWLRG